MTKQDYLEFLNNFLKIESVSTYDHKLADMEKARQYLSKLLSDMGFEVQFLKAKKHDAVFAQRIFDPNFPTVLIYGHYDVQPAEPLEEWISPAFEPTVRNQKLYARGAIDNKGQIMANLMAVKKYLAENAPKVNFKFIIEGEEEIGSMSVEDLVSTHRNLFKADYLIVSDSEMPRAGQPAIDISLRGIIYTELTIESAKQDIHSGQFGGIAENPAILLARVITELKDKNNHINIPKFYDDVLNPTPKETRIMRKNVTSESELKAEGQFWSIGGGEKDYTLNERRWSRPTLDVNGIYAGYISEGAKTIIPSKATAKISLRIVPNQNPTAIFKNMRSFIKSLLPKDVKFTLTKFQDALPYKAPTDDPIFDLMMQSQKKIYSHDSIFQGVGGSIGFIPIMANALKIPCIMVGFALPDGGMHSPNEHITLDNYYQAINLMTDFYQNLGH